MDSPQLQLPFLIEGNVAPRDIVRKVATATDGRYKVNVSSMAIRPNFNYRIKPEGVSEADWEKVLRIPELADAIYLNNGPAHDIVGDILRNDTKFYITDGERRYRAIMHLVTSGRMTYPNGSLVSDVYVILNKPGTTDLERKKKIWSTQDNMPLSPMQKANFLLSCKMQDGLTHDEIGKEYGLSRQTVDIYILATQMPKDVQEKIESGEIKLSNAIAKFREEKRGDTKRILNVDEESGEILDEETAKYEKLKHEMSKANEHDGDQDEFKMQDNVVSFPGSMSGPKEEGSGTIVVGTDSIYKQAQDLAALKQFIARYEFTKTMVTKSVLERLPNALDTMNDEIENHIADEVVNRLRNEYTIIVK